MTETISVTWCSLFCTGNEAIGEIQVSLIQDEWTTVPVCRECLEEITKDPDAALARIRGF